MKKVYITKVLKGKEPIHSIGLLDTDNKSLIIPFVSKKGLPMCEVVDMLEIVALEDNSYKCQELVLLKDGSKYINTYFANILK